MYMEDVPGRAGQDAIERSHGNRMRAVPAKHSFNVEISNRELDHPSKQAAEAFQAMVSLQAKLASKLAEGLSEEEMKRHRGLRPSLEQISKDDRHETPDILSYTLAKFAAAKDKVATSALENQRLEFSLDNANEFLESSRKDGLRITDDLREANENVLALKLQSAKDTAKLQELEAANESLEASRRDESAKDTAKLQELEAANAKALKDLSSSRRKARHRKKLIRTLQTEAPTLPDNEPTIAEYEAEIQNYIQSIQQQEDRIASLKSKLRDVKKAEKKLVKASEETESRNIEIAELQRQLEVATQSKERELKKGNRVKSAHGQEQESSLAKIAKLQEDVDGSTSSLQSITQQLKTANDGLTAKNEQLEALGLEKSKSDEAKAALALKFAKEKGDLESKHQRTAKDYEATKAQLDEANMRLNGLFALEQQKKLIQQRLETSRNESAELGRQKNELERRHEALRSELTAAKESTKVGKEKADEEIKRLQSYAKAVDQKYFSAQSAANTRLENESNAKTAAEKSLEATKVQLQEAINARTESEVSAEKSKQALRNMRADMVNRDTTIAQQAATIQDISTEHGHTTAVLAEWSDVFTSVGRQILKFQVLPEYTTCQDRSGTLPEQIQKSRYTT
jgi:myosin heavy subunit